MTEERRIQIVAEVDATRARAGLTEISRDAGTMAGAVAERSRQADAAIGAIGGGAARSAAQVAAAQRAMIASIERTTVATQAGGRSTAAYYELLARQRGVDPASIAPFLAALRAQEDLQRRANAATESGAAAQRQAAESARAQAAAQRELAQAQAAGQNFLNGLREQIQLYGRSAEEVMKYRAAQAGVAGAAAPLILQLQNQRAAHEAVAKAAQEQATAQRQAAQAQTRRDDFIEGLQQQAAAIGKTRVQLLELQAAQMGVTQQAAPFIARLREAEGGVARAGVSAAQTAAALRGVPAQFTDIITSIQGGQAPLTVLLQQGGQLKDMFGGAGEAAGALGGYIKGLISPTTLAIAAVAALAFAQHEGAAEAKAYSRALAITGNAAGSTVNDMADAARRIGQISGNQGAAAAALASLAETGRVPAASMQRFADVTVQAQKVIGRSVADTVADFAALGKSPLSALEDINTKYRFITASTYAQVKALSDQGRAAEAANLAQQAYADGIDKQRQRVLDSLTDWERGWIRIKRATSGAIDAVLDVGRGATNFEKINSLLQTRATIEANLASARTLRNDAEIASYEKQLDLNKDQINAIRDKGDAAKATAAAAAKAVLDEEAKTKWMKDGDQYLTRRALLEREIVKTQNEGVAAGASQEDIDARISGVRRKYADIFNDGIDSNIEALKRRAAVEDVLTQRTIARIAANLALGGTREEDAINATADAEDKAFARKRANLASELELVKGKQNSLKDQQALAGEIAVLDAQRISAQIKREQDLAALQFQRAQRSRELFNAGINQAAEERNSISDQIKSQLDYNEEIGRSATELVMLRSARLLHIASMKEESAAALEQFEAGSPLAEQYRDQAALLRSLASAQRDAMAKQKDPYVAIRASLIGYRDDAVNVGGQIGDAMTNAFRGAEDAFVSFVTTGKLNFASLATSIVADLARIQAKKALAGLADLALSSLFGSPSGPGTTGFDGYANIAGARAAGGPVTGGLSYLVGEKGPEIFTPSSSGKIIANHAIGGGAGGDINISTVVQVTAGGATSQTTGDSSAQGRALADVVNASVKDAFSRESRQGGLLWKMQQGRA